MTLYEEVHPLAQMASRAVHKRFVVRFCAMLPPGCRPIVITDAGFRSPWFQLVQPGLLQIHVQKPAEQDIVIEHSQNTRSDRTE